MAMEPQHPYAPEPPVSLREYLELRERVIRLEGRVEFLQTLLWMALGASGVTGVIGLVGGALGVAG